MCGIAGYISFQGDAANLDLNLIQHRGPDSGGEWCSSDRRVWLGMTRLAILDLSPSGNQPMTDPVTQNVIVSNGEIYNHLVLRPELEHLGARFAGTSDTETLLAAYRHWGEAMLSRLKGMFAFAIFNQADGSIFLARDRLGIKPLYLRQSAAGFAFASETRMLVATEKIQPTGESIGAYLQWGCCPHSSLLYPGLVELPVGSHLRITREKTGEPVRYWPPKRFPSLVSGNDRTGIVRKTRELIERSVKEHILSDVPVASFLSGGIDSSVITALAARELSKDLHTFSVGFEHAGYDESKFARLIATKYNTDHHEIKLSPEEVIETVKEAVMKMDLPSMDAINTYIVAKQVAQQGYKVALAGVGGDELFGGYPQFRFLSRLKRLALVPPAVRSLLLLTGKARHILTDVPARADAGLFDQWWRRSWNASLLQSAGFDKRRIPEETRPELLDDFARISWSELSHYMRDILLRDSDQMSMAVSLEVRVPFLDHELVEFVLGLPRGAKEKPGQVKSLLIEATADLLPAEIYQRKKMGFELPMPHWIKGPLDEFALAGLRHTVERGAFSEAHTESLYQAFAAGKLHWARLWTAVVLGWYLKKEDLRIAPN